MPAGAVDRFGRTPQRSVACVSRSVLVGKSLGSAGVPYQFRFAEDRGARLGRSSRTALSVRLLCRTSSLSDDARLWNVMVDSYEYRVLARDGPSIVTYHWHPVGQSPVVHRHLHVGGRTAPVDLSKAHLPTGPISVPAVIRTTITEFGVEPLRPDWDDVLAQAEQALAS